MASAYYDKIMARVAQRNADFATRHAVSVPKLVASGRGVSCGAKRKNISALQQITVGILSWNALNTVRQTLTSYQTFGLDALDKLICFQQMTEQDASIADEFGYSYIGLIKNMNIAGGLANIAKFAKRNYLLFLENDWQLVTPYEDTLAEALYIIDTGIADVVRLRHRQQPGEPLWPRGMSGLELERHLLDCVHWESTPEQQHSEIKKITLTKDWYVTTPKNANWTNNPILVKLSWLKEQILPNSRGNTETAIKPWWEQQNFAVAQGDGLFTHNRIDR